MGIKPEEQPEYKEAASRAYTAWKVYDDYKTAVTAEQLDMVARELQTVMKQREVERGAERKAFAARLHQIIDEWVEQERS